MERKSETRSFSRNFRFSEKPLFKDADLLECDHVPDQVLFRDAELEELAFLIRPGLRGQRPANILCRGLPATGKTTCIHHLFAELKEHAHHLIPVYVNCQRSRTAFAVFSTIYRELVGHAPPSSGIPLRKLMDAVAKALQTKNAILLVCLDDIHHLIHESTANQILSSLLRLYLDHPGCRASVILVESDLTLDISRALDRSVASSLCVQEVFFAPYTANQIRGILRERSRQATYPGVVSPEILDQITDLIMDRTTAAEPVDLRVGIDLLKRSILRAERAAHTTVTEDDVAAAYGDARTTHLRGLVSTLTGKERLLLSVIATMTEEAWKEYRESVRAAREKTVSESTACESTSSGSTLPPTPTPPTSGRIYTCLLEAIEGEALRRRSGEVEEVAEAATSAGNEATASGKAAAPEIATPQATGAAACAEPAPGYGAGKDDAGENSLGRDGNNTTHPSSNSSSNPSSFSPSSGPYSGYCSCSYTSFYEQLRSLASYKLIGITGVQGKGRTSAITLRHQARDVKRICEAEMERQGEREKR